MTKRIDIDKILRSNPDIDKVKLEKNVRQIEELDKLGVHNYQYRLLSPFCQIGASKADDKVSSNSACLKK